MRVLDAASVENPEALISQPDPAMAKQKQLMDAAAEEMMVSDLRMREVQIEKIEAETLAVIAKAEKDAAEVDLLPMKMRIEELKTIRDALKVRREAITMNRPNQAASQGVSPPQPA